MNRANLTFPNTMTNDSDQLIETFESETFDTEKLKRKCKRIQ
jgi:hypothetical protein